MPIHAKNKGSAYERKLAQEFRNVGFVKCKTSREESKTLDDQKVDFCFTHPFNIQAKAVEKLGTPHKVLAEMPKDSNFNLLFHKVNRKGEVVSMFKEDFYKLLDLLIKKKAITL